jgi:transcriptional regulator with GAF, ATPase, and Fis domain
VFYKVEQIAGTDTNVLILGETGTGKELVARAIHGMSLRKDRALVKMNCAALPSNLIESELFGHEKGAFTGAHSRRLGDSRSPTAPPCFWMRSANCPGIAAQAAPGDRNGEFERLGSSETKKVDVRIIAATNRNLEEEVRKGRFREDLWYRLNIFPDHHAAPAGPHGRHPAAGEFLRRKDFKKDGQIHQMVPVSVMDALQSYHWPGNIRELENVLERAVISSSGPKLRLKPSRHLSTGTDTLEAVERNHILRVLEQTNWKVSGKNSAAEILGLDRSTLRARMIKLNIQK